MIIIFKGGLGRGPEPQDFKLELERKEVPRKGDTVIINGYRSDGFHALIQFSGIVHGVQWNYAPGNDSVTVYLTKG